MKNFVCLFVVIFTAIVSCMGNIERSFNYQDSKSPNVVLVMPTQYLSFMRGSELVLAYYADKDATKLADCRTANLKIYTMWFNAINKDAPGWLWIDGAGAPVASIAESDVFEIMDTLIARGDIILEPVTGQVTVYSLVFGTDGRWTGKFATMTRQAYPNEMRYVLRRSSTGKKYVGPSALCGNPFPDMLGLENLSTVSVTPATPTTPTPDINADLMKQIQEMLKQALVNMPAGSTPNININIATGGSVTNSGNSGFSTGTGNSGGMRFTPQFMEANSSLLIRQIDGLTPTVIEKTIIKEVAVGSSDAMSDAHFNALYGMAKKELALQRADLALTVILGAANLGLGAYNTWQLNQLRKMYGDFNCRVPDALGPDMGGTVGPNMSYAGGNGTVGPQGMRLKIR